MQVVRMLSLWGRPLSPAMSTFKLAVDRIRVEERFIPRKEAMLVQRPMPKENKSCAHLMPCLYIREICSFSDTYMD